MRGLILTLSTAVLVAAMAGCSSTGDTTCQEFAEMDFSEQSSTLRSLLRAHDLDPDDTGNNAGVATAVAELCGSGVLVGTSSNPDAVLDDAADWDSMTW